MTEKKPNFGAPPPNYIPWRPSEEEIKKIKAGGRITMAARWDCAATPTEQTRLEWLIAAFPDTPKKELKKLADKRWFQNKEEDREILRKAVEFSCPVAR
jgi:hypothetical protein